MNLNFKQPVKFFKKFTSETNYFYYKRDENGKISMMLEADPELLNYLNQGQTVQTIPYITNQAISITNIIETIDNSFREITNGPLETPYGFPIDFSRQSNDELQGGILMRILSLYQFGQLTTLTTDEINDLMIGTLRGSVYEKSKSMVFYFTDYNNKVQTITIEIARNLAFLQAQTYAALFAKKQEMKSFIMDTIKVSDEMKLPYKNKQYIHDQYMNVVKALYQAV